MKKKLQQYLSLLCLLITLSYSTMAWGQINYTANFDAGMESWSSPGFDFSQYTGATACAVGSVRTNLYSGNPDAILVSPTVGTSTGGLIVMSYDYKVANWSANTVGTTNPWGQFVVEYAASAAGPWTLVPNSAINQTNHTVSASCATKQVSFSAPAGAVFVRFNSTWTSGDYYLNYDNISLVEIPNPPTPVQAAGTPTCASGSSIDLTGTPPANTTWYWQTSASGTSTANAYAGPMAISANGTYYVRAFNSTYNVWSNASSIVVTNFPSAATPMSPTAAVNPACSPGTTISMPAAPAGTEYYWQGTVVNGSSNANPATAPYNVTASGTYTVAAYETATQCWSSTSSVTVTVHTIIPPNAVVDPTYFNYCTSAPSMPVSAATPAPSTNLVSCVSSASAAGPDNSGVTATVNDFSCVTGTPVSATLSASIGNQCTNWYSYDIIVNGVTVATNQCNQSNFNLAAYLPLTSVSIVSVDEDVWADNVTMNLTVTVNHIAQPYSLSWFSAASGGSSFATGSPVEAIGTPVLPVAANGSYQFYVANNQGGCESAARTLVTLNVTDVLAVLNPVNITCNGMDNGSFTLGAVTCGTAPFTYSVDGGAFGPIPTDLTPGVHSIVMKDASLPTQLNSAPISITISEPSAPTALNAFNITFFNAMLTWTPQGNETTWNVEYGPAGFTPGTGTMMSNVTNDTVAISGLTEDTDYEFYVQAGCAAGSAWGGPYAFSTDVPFSAWDSQCGPGFTPIHTTGTALNLADDASTGITTVNPISFQGVTSNNITVSNNGWIQFGGVTLNAWQTDLDSEEGNVYWEETTIGGDNYLIVEWHNRPRFSGVIGQNVTFELAVNQTTGEIFYLYEDVVFGGSQSSSDYAGNFATISASGPMSTITISYNSQTYLQNNSCVRFYTALCPNITSVNAILVPDEAILDWSAGLYGETNWNLVYGLEGFDPNNAPEVLGDFDYSTPDADLTGLEQNTTYEVIIYSDCAADNIMSEGFHYVFTTPPFCANPTAFAGGSDVDSLELTWNWSAFNASYPISEFNFQYGMNGQTASEAMATGTNNADTIFDANLLAGGVYQVYIQATCTNPSLGTDTSAWVGPINIVMPLSNDTVCGAEMLTLNTPYTFNNVGATVSVDEASIAPPATGAQTTTGWANSTLNNTTWFRFVAPASGSVRINNTATNYNGQLAVYDVADCGDFSSSFLMVNANDNEIDGTSLAPNFTICGLNPGDTYYILHDGSGTTGNYSVIVTEIVLEAGLAEPLTQICTGEVMDLFSTISGNDTDGVWSAPIAAANASISGSTFNSAGLGYQVFNFEYRMTDGCAYDSIVSQVQIFGLSSAGTDGMLTVCKNEPFNLIAGLGGSFDAGGQWYDISNNPTTSDQIASQFPGSFNYDYITGNGVCPDDTSNVVVTVLNSCDWASIEEAVFAGVQLYPNPTSGTIHIDADNVFAIEITDANGRMINSDYKTTIGTTTINLSKVEVGVYFVTLRNEAASKVFRVVVQ
jgi:hypothetical protein